MKSSRSFAQCLNHKLEIMSRANYHKTVTNFDVLVGDIEQDQLVRPRLEGILSCPTHCHFNQWNSTQTPNINSKCKKEKQKIRVHSLGKHRQQLASCATLWRLFPTRDREHELSFLLLFVFSLLLRKERKKMKWERSEAATHNCSAREKLSVGKWNYCERSFLYFFYYAFVRYTIFLKRRAQCTQISSFYFFCRVRTCIGKERRIILFRRRQRAYCTNVVRWRETFFSSTLIASL